MVAVKLKRDPNFNLIQDSYDERSFRGEYDGSNNLIYAGYAVPGSAEGDRVWQIRRMTYATNNRTDTEWPEIDSKASTDYSFSWTARATYTYS
jgi:hypothetical protein